MTKISIASILIHGISFVHTFKQSIQAGNQDNINLFQDLKEFVILVLVFYCQANDNSRLVDCYQTGYLY